MTFKVQGFQRTKITR